MNDLPQEETAPAAPVTRSKAAVNAGTTARPLIPTDIDSSWRLATAFAASNMLPKSYYDDEKGDPVAKAFTAMQIGAEVGLNPITAIQSIAVVNGVATLWGDTQKALVLNSGRAEFVREGYDGDDVYLRSAGDHNTKTPNLQFKAWCETKRIGTDEVVRTEYSVQDAIDAGLWGGKDPWKKHPKRMLRYKARAFCLRDVYPDVLKGLTHSAEEMEGEMIDVTPKLSTSNTKDNPAAKLSGLLKQDGIDTVPINDGVGMNNNVQEVEMVSQVSPATNLRAESEVLIEALEKESYLDDRRRVFAEQDGGNILLLLREKSMDDIADKIQFLTNQKN